MLKPFYFIFLLLFYLKEIMVSGWVMAKVILNGKELLDGIFTIETNLYKPRQVIFLFNLISMTPGTLSVDLYDDNRKIDVHVLDMRDKAAIERTIARLEHLIQKGL